MTFHAKQCSVSLSAPPASKEVWISVEGGQPAPLSHQSVDKLIAKLLEAKKASV